MLVGLLTRPQLGHHVERLGRLPGGQDHAVPRRGLFLLLAPEEHVRTQAAVRRRRDRGLVAHPERLGLLRARLLERRAPRGFRALPVPARTPLGDEVRAVVAASLQGGGHARDVGRVRVHRQQIDVGAQLDERVDLLGLAPRDDDIGRMMGVDRLHDLREFVQLTEDQPRVAHQFDLVADSPREQRGVVLELGDRVADHLPLPLDRGLIAVVEPVTRVPDPDAHVHRQTVCVRLVEHALRVIDVPGANRVRPRGRELREVAPAPRTAHKVRLAPPEHPVSVGGLLDAHRDRPFGLMIGMVIRRPMNGAGRRHQQRENAREHEQHAGKVEMWHEQIVTVTRFSDKPAIPDTAYFGVPSGYGGLVPGVPDWGLGRTVGLATL